MGKNKDKYYYDYYDDRNFRSGKREKKEKEKKEKKEKKRQKADSKKAGKARFADDEVVPVPEQLLALFKPRSTEEITGLKRTNKLLLGTYSQIRFNLFNSPQVLTVLIAFLVFTAALVVFFFCGYEWLYAFLITQKENGGVYIDALNAGKKKLAEFLTTFQSLGFAVLLGFSALCFSIIF